MINPIEMMGKKAELMSPESYLSLNEREKANIIQTNIVPCKLGSRDFGKIQVVYRLPVYKIKK